ncbi:hypothetical protein OG589_27470 [Sphaerisporangium sp. NBC_01403]|uniref:hypothetical protein n=1 Tax=Sphaerisporangium sp. NBC_01403 TaxID=2903599 RepID=UPI003252D306
MRREADLHQAASALQRENAGWVVMWGTWRRRFCAFSGLIHPTGVIVEATTPERLLVLIRQVEAETRTTRPVSTPRST